MRPQRLDAITADFVERCFDGEPGARRVRG
jgi:hypothetical protein